MMTEDEYNERERMVEKVKSFFFDRKEVVSFLASVSVKIVGTLLCLLVPSMFVYKVW